MIKLFQEHEAWALFKTTAIGEACGWVLLLYGIAALHYHLPGASFMLPVGGSIHGMLFLTYLAVTLAGFTSLGWSIRKAIFAICMSVIPFATWGFEAWCASRRRAAALGAYRQVIIKPVIQKGDSILAVQLSTGLDWVIPGAPVKALETPLEAAKRVTFELTGVHPTVSSKPVIQDSDSGPISLYFTISDPSRYHLAQITPHLKQSLAVDEIAFTPQDQIPELARVKPPLLVD